MHQPSNFFDPDPPRGGAPGDRAHDLDDLPGPAGKTDVGNEPRGRSRAGTPRSNPDRSRCGRDRGPRRLRMAPDNGDNGVLEDRPPAEDENSTGCSSSGMLASRSSGSTPRGDPAATGSPVSSLLSLSTNSGLGKFFAVHGDSQSSSLLPGPPTLRTGGCGLSDHEGAGPGYR